MFGRITVQTAGESHGRGMLVTLTGVPAGLDLDLDWVDGCLARRQAGFGRSARQQLEQDRADVLSGLVGGVTTGAPLALMVWNKDDSLADKSAFTRPRPGHADLAGGCKYGTTDMRGILERASARETAARVAAGAVAEDLLRRLEIDVLGYLVGLGPHRVPGPTGKARPATLRRRRDKSPFHALHTAGQAELEQAVLDARAAGDTLGGVVEVTAWGLPAGLGSLSGLGTRLDARLASALMSIQAMKAVEIGEGVAAASRRGSAVHDEVGRPGPDGPRRPTNRAGGLEGGMTNGEPLVARAFMKPIATLARPLTSWDYAQGKASEAFFERSDVTAVPAAAVIAEAMVGLVVLDALLEKTGGDTVDEVGAALSRHRRRVARRFGRPGNPRRGR